MEYHWIVSINRPSGYEPDALPLRHSDTYIQSIISLSGFLYNNLNYFLIFQVFYIFLLFDNKFKYFCLYL